MASYSENGATIEFPEEEMRAHLEAIARQGPIVSARALTLAGEALLGEAQYDAPVKTGFLKESHSVDTRGLPEFVDLGASANYAIYVHEEHKEKRQWFLRAIARNARRVLEGALKRAMREAGADG